MSSPPPPSPTDRQTTTPFHLKLFYHTSFRPLTTFPIPTPQDPSPTLLPHLQIYTWPSCTLLELSQLITSTLPHLLPVPAVGTRLAFRLIYPDTRPLAAGRMREDDRGGAVRGRWTSKELGSVVVAAPEEIGTETGEGIGMEGNGPGEEESKPKTNGSATVAPALSFASSADSTRTLASYRFVIGDLVDCAILPPLADGSVAPPLSAPSAHRGGYAGRGGGRENGFAGGRGRSGGFGGGYGSGGGGGGGRGDAYPATGSGFAGAADRDRDRERVPQGEWRRGERVPDGGGGGERERERGGGAGYGGGRGYGAGRGTGRGRGY